MPVMGLPWTSQAFLVNVHGEMSALRGIEYFRPRTSITLKTHCLSLGGYVWTGSSALIDPFHDFCLESRITCRHDYSRFPACTCAGWLPEFDGNYV